MSIQDILVYKMMVSKFCLPDRLVLVDKPIYWERLTSTKDYRYTNRICF